MNDDEQLAWVAGIIDGEGCLDITHNFAPRIRVRMCDEATLIKVHDVLQVGNIVKEKPPTNPRHNLKWCWATCNPKDVFLALCLIHPFLVTKSSQSAVLLMFSHPRGSFTFDEKETMRLDMKRLKGKEVSNEDRRSSKPRRKS